MIKAKSSEIPKKQDVHSSAVRNRMIPNGTQNTVSRLYHGYQARLH